MKLKFPSVRPWLRLFLASACLMLVACGARVDLMGSVPEEEANEVLAALLKADIAAEKTAGKEGMVGVRVDATQVGRALEVMRENGLPRERFAGMGQVFKKEGLISSPLEERARYIYALSQELSNTLSKIDGVLAARVHVVLPERGAAGETGVPSTSLSTMVPMSDRLRMRPTPRIRYCSAYWGSTPPPELALLRATAS